MDCSDGHERQGPEPARQQGIQALGALVTNSLPALLAVMHNPAHQRRLDAVSTVAPRSKLHESHPAMVPAIEVICQPLTSVAEHFWPLDAFLNWHLKPVWQIR
jgi:hypothetical protein